jgi:archaellum component FlaD/FlaE
MVKTQWISSSLKLSPAFLVLSKKWFLKWLDFLVDETGVPGENH